MTDSEFYADPGRNLDTDDHARLLDENREAYDRERASRLIHAIDSIEDAKPYVDEETAERMENAADRLRAELEVLRQHE